jgi:LEA14-like dessication related protein
MSSPDCVAVIAENSAGCHVVLSTRATGGHRAYAGRCPMTAMVARRRLLTMLGVALVGLVLLVGLGYLFGVFGVPSVETVENRFESVNESTTTIHSTVDIHNPNPIGISLGNLGISYAIDMNDVRMATGGREGVSVETGNSSVAFQTHLANDQIPQWWSTHVANDEVTNVVVDVVLSHGLLGGGAFEITQAETVETDILGQFNSTETRPIDADAPVISDPVLYLNETAAWYGSNLTERRTPIEMGFTVYNPKSYPYTVTELGYEIRMNGIAVGEGSSSGSYAIPGGSERTIRATTVLRNERLDDWWVSHLERDQVTNLTVDTYVIVDPDAAGVLGETVPEFRIDSDELDYETVIETDIFGTKDDDGLHPGSGGGDGGTATPTPEVTATPTTPADGTATPAPTQTDTDTDTPMVTPLPTPTPTDDGGILS